MAAERHRMLDVDALLVGLPVTRATLSDERNRVSWDLWSVLCERAVAQLDHDPARIDRASALIVDTGPRGYAGFIGPVAAVFASPVQLFRLVARWGGPALYRSHEFALDELGADRLRLTVRLRPGMRPCLAWFQMMPAALAAVPGFIGLPDASVTVEHMTATEGRFLVTTPRTMRARWRTVLAALRAPGAIADELGFQQQQLVASLEALRHSEGGFRAALDALPAFVALHRDRTIAYVNPALRAVADRELVGASLTELVGDDDQATLAQLLATTTTAGGLTRLRLRRAGGGTIEVDAAIVPVFEFGGQPTSGLVALDVSERVRAEETNRFLVQALPDLLVRLDRDGRLLDVHAGAELAALAEVLRPRLGRIAWDEASVNPTVPDVLRTRARTVITAALTTGVEQRLTLDADLDRPRRFQLRAVPGAGGREVVVLLRDVTTEHETERRLAVAERMASVGTLAAAVAHEINNPLTYVLGGLDELTAGLTALAEGGVEVAELRHRLAEVTDGAHRVRQIVAALRGYTRVDDTTTQATSVLTDVVERALAICGNQLRGRVRLERVAGAAPTVVGDPNQLVQVVVNLVVNAVQALGEVERPDPWVRITTATDARGWATLEVADNGPGIPAARLGHVFEPFYTTKPRGLGTGLGLSISQRILHALGGAMGVDSVEGAGSCFTVTLPPAAPPPPPVEVPPTPPPTAAVTTPLRILVVDDEAPVARILARLLTGQGHVVATAGSAGEALAALAGEAFDLVICDVMMPGTSGIELYERLAAERPEVAARFVLATGGAYGLRDRASLDRLGCPVIEKPFSPAALQLHLDAAGARRQRRGGAPG